MQGVPFQSTDYSTGSPGQLLDDSTAELAVSLQAGHFGQSPFDPLGQTNDYNRQAEVSACCNLITCSRWVLQRSSTLWANFMQLCLLPVVLKQAHSLLGYIICRAATRQKLAAKQKHQKLCSCSERTLPLCLCIGLGLENSAVMVRECPASRL